MRKKFLLAAGLLAMVMMIPSMVMASMVVNTGPYTSWSTGVGGGEFTAVVDSGTPFQTFCLEYNEHFNPGTTYDWSISQVAKAGGVGAVSGEDPLSIGVAFLYSEFRKGTLAGYDYSSNNNHVIQAGLLQEAIWALEEEWWDDRVLVNQYWLLVGGVAGQQSGGGNGVYVFNLTGVGNPNDLKQDMLGWGSDGGGNVPIPPTVYLLGAGLLGLVGFRRKFKK